MRKISFFLLLILLVGCSSSSVTEGIPIETVKDNWHQNTDHLGHDLELGELNEENLTRIGDEPNLLFGVDDPENVTEIQIISRSGHSSENLDKMIAIMGALITTLDDDLTMSIDDIDYIENWLVNNENKDLNDHHFRVDGDIEDTHYIFAYVNHNKE